MVAIVYFFVFGAMYSGGSFKNKKVKIVFGVVSVVLAAVAFRSIYFYHDDVKYDLEVEDVKKISLYGNGLRLEVTDEKLIEEIIASFNDLSDIERNPEQCGTTADLNIHIYLDNDGRVSLGSLGSSMWIVDLYNLGRSPETSSYIGYSDELLLLFSEANIYEKLSLKLNDIISGKYGTLFDGIEFVEIENKDIDDDNTYHFMAYANVTEEKIKEISKQIEKEEIYIESEYKKLRLSIELSENVRLYKCEFLVRANQNDEIIDLTGYRNIYIDEEKSIIVLEYINPAVKNNK